MKLLEENPPDTKYLILRNAYSERIKIEFLLKSIVLQQRLNIFEILKNQKGFKMQKSMYILSNDVLSLYEEKKLDFFLLEESKDLLQNDVKFEKHSLGEKKEIERFPNDLTDYKDPKYFESLINQLPNNYKLNTKIYLPSHYHLSMLYQFHSEFYLKNIISDEIGDLETKVKCQELIHQVSFVAKDYQIQREKRINILNNYRKFIKNYIKRMNNLRLGLFISLFKRKFSSQLLLLEWNKRLDNCIMKWKKIYIYLKRRIKNFCQSEQNIVDLDYEDSLPLYISRLFLPISFIKLKTNPNALLEDIPDNLFVKNIPPSLCAKYLKEKSVNIQTEGEMVQELVDKWKIFLKNENDEFERFYFGTDKKWSRIFEMYWNGDYLKEVEMVNTYIDKVYVRLTFIKNRKLLLKRLRKLLNLKSMKNNFHLYF